MTGLAFKKYHGLGNDFVVIDALSGGRRISPAGAAAICDRHSGAGGDGVLTLLPSRRASFRMHIFNADGSVPEMCGNGIRCAVKHAAEQGRAKPRMMGPRARSFFQAMGFDSHRASSFRVYDVETGRGVLSCAAEIQGGAVASVAVDMGAPILDRPGIPMRGRGVFVERTVRANGRKFTGTAVSMGNPHLVLFHRDDIDDARAYGPALETSPLFPRKTNVEFARAMSSREIRAVVWERGVGITQACGTGACATAVAFAIAGKVPFGREVTVRLPGGSLGVVVREDLAAVYMKGPAAHIFDGTLAEQRR
ncbi:MAG: diaminopimelate epimerase [Deltaproteobacteria bacterium]|nr:diaminopimelate epimerase [Deltaproteobacteria bacterium]